MRQDREDVSIACCEHRAPDRATIGGLSDRASGTDVDCIRIDRIDRDRFGAERVVLPDHGPALPLIGATVDAARFGPDDEDIRIGPRHIEAVDIGLPRIGHCIIAG